MKLFILIGVFALAALADAQPLVDTVQQYNRPFPPVKKPLQPVILKPAEQIVEPQPPVVYGDEHHKKPVVVIDEEHPATPPEAIEEEHHATPPVATDEEHHAKSPVEVVEELMQNIANVIKHKPDIDYYNGKIVPTPKYPKHPKALKKE